MAASFLMLALTRRGGVLPPDEDGLQLIFRHPRMLRIRRRLLTWLDEGPFYATHHLLVFRRRRSSTCVGGDNVNWQERVAAKREN
jgi:hypothetical protein